MNLSEITRDDFLCVGNCTMATTPSDVFDGVAFLVGDLIGNQISPLGGGYALHAMITGPGDPPCFYIKPSLSAFIGATCFSIAAQHQGKGLAIPMILAAVPNRPKPASRILSEPGKRALDHAWRVANGQAPNPWP
ncbi:MAG: hypothetical protein QOF32_2576 [Gammaproteobacteria bacterium]|nr:hypothetical protein [Gammaproteobacteria bacterium]